MTSLLFSSNPFLSSLRNTAFLLLFCCVQSGLWGQWQAYTPALSDTMSTFDLCIAHDNDQVVWAIGTKLQVTATAFTLIPTDSLFFTKTSDGGATWSGGTIPRGAGSYTRASSICPVSANSAWICEVNNAYVSYIMHTQDGGLTWVRQLEDGFNYPTSYANVVYFWDESSGIAIGDPAKSDTQTTPFFEIYTTSDGGENWARVSSDSIPAALGNEYGWYGDYQVIGDHIWFTSFNLGTNSFRRVFHSTNRGQSWTAANAFTGAISFADELHGIGATYNSQNQTNVLRYTEDGGATWSALPPLPGGRLSSLVIIPESHYLLSVQRNNNVSGPFHTMISTDLGENWVEIGTGSEHAAEAKFSSPTVGYAGELQSTAHATRMYKYIGDPLTGLFSGLTLDAQVSITPNPATDYCQLRIQTAQPADFVLLLNDMKGRLMARQNLDKNAQGYAHIDLSGLPAGIYVLTVSSEKGYLTQKIVKQ